MKQQLLLLEDVDSLGRKGEIVSAKSGYIRNYLLPKGYAVIATSNMLRKQERLKKERAEQAVINRKESEELAMQIEAISSLQIHVKVDPEGRMYGSVSAADIVELFAEKSLSVEKKSILVIKPIKETGVHTIPLRLKEGVEVSCKLSILPEGFEEQAGIEEVTAPIDSKKADSEEEPKSE